MTGDNESESTARTDGGVTGLYPRRQLRLWLSAAFRSVSDRRVVSVAVDRPVVWLLPAAAFLGVFQVYPMVEAFRLSLTNTSLLDPAAATYIGLRQFGRLLTSGEFLSTVRVTGIYTATSVVLHVGLGLGIALAIDYGVRRRLYGHVTTRIAVLLAWVVPGVIIGLVWQVLLIESRFGVVNYALTELGVGTVPFLSDPLLALGSAVAAGAWRGTAFAMIMLYAGLRRVPPHLYDAARVDGAGPVQRFRYVTLPQLRPVVFVTTVLVTIYSLNTFDLIFALTGGGPGRATEVLALFMYQEGFGEFNLGRAAAVAVVMLGINLLLTGVYLRVFDLGEDL